MTQFLWFAATATGGLALVWLSLRPLRGLTRGQRAALAALRSVTVLAAAAAAAGPVWTLRRTIVVPAPVIVALDNSASMAIPDCQGGRSRAEAVARRLLAPGGLLDRWAAKRDVEVYGFGELLVPLARRKLSATDDVTDFHAALRQLKAEARRAGAAAVVVVSDGVDTRGLRPAEAAAAAVGLPPVYAVVVGGDRRLPNTAILAVDCPRQVEAGKPVDVTVTVKGRAGGRVKVHWKVCDGQAGEGVAKLGNRGVGRAGARLVPRRPGLQRLEVGLVGQRPGLLPADDSTVLAFDVLPAQRRVVYLAGAPSPQVATLRRLLARIKGLKVTVAVKKAPADGWWQELPRLKKLGDVEGAEGFAAAVAYIIGNLAEKDLPPTAWRTIARRAQAGEAAVCALGGPKSEKLPPAIQGLLPARMGPVQPRAAHAARPGGGLELRGELWQGLPALAEINALGALAAGARVVVKAADGAGLVALREDGPLRSAAVATDTLFRWVFSAAATQRSRAAYEDFWLKMLAWLTRPRPPRALTLMPDKLTALRGEPIILTARTAASAERVEVAVVRGGKVVGRVKLRRQAVGLFGGVVPALKPGKWVLRGRAYDRRGRAIGKDRVTVVAAARSREWRWPQPDQALLAAIAKATGGRVLKWQEIERLPEMWPKDKHRREIARRIDAARGMGAGAVIIMLLAADWILRRRWGMV